jgi:Uma2 family endonuclease
MSTSAAISRPHFKADAGFHTWTGEQYDHFVETGVLTKEDKVELLEGYVVQKMPANPPHDFAVTTTAKVLNRVVPAGWTTRNQVGARLTESRPEPDVSIARGTGRDYIARQPGSADLGLVVEVSDSSLARDELDKTRIYARDSIPVYWVVNLVNRRVEVFTDPTGPNPPAGLPGGPDPHYRTRQDYPAGTAVPVVLDGATVGTISVDELLP